MGWSKIELLHSLALEPVTPGSFRCGFLVGGSHRRRGSAILVVRLHRMKTLFPQTVNRLEYLVRLLIFLGAAIFLGLSARPFQHQIPVWFTVISVAILFIIRFMCLDIPRCRSMQWSPWLVLLLLIPIVNLVMQLLLLIIPAKVQPHTAQGRVKSP